MSGYCRHNRIRRSACEACSAKAAGASKVVVTGMGACKAVRFPAALSLGADFVVNVEQDDPVEFVKDLTNGRGADLVVETSGAEPAIRQSVDLVRTRGRISAIGIPKKETVAFPWTRAMHKVIDVRFNMSSSYTSWDRALSLMAGTSKNLRQLITHTTTINHWKTVFDDLEAERGIKALFIPEA